MHDGGSDTSPPLRQIVVSAEVISAFERHADHLRERKRQRARELQLRSHLEADSAVVAHSHDAGDAERVVDEESFGVWKLGDVWQGDVCLRTLHDLLLKIDREGYERCVCHWHPRRSSARPYPHRRCWQVLTTS